MGKFCTRKRQPRSFPPSSRTLFPRPRERIRIFPVGDSGEFKVDTPKAESLRVWVHYDKIAGTKRS